MRSSTLRMPFISKNGLNAAVALLGGKLSPVFMDWISFLNAKCSVHILSKIRSHCFVLLVLQIFQYFRRWCALLCAILAKLRQSHSKMCPSFCICCIALCCLYLRQCWMLLLSSFLPCILSWFLHLLLVLSPFLLLSNLFRAAITILGLNGCRFFRFST